MQHWRLQDKDNLFRVDVCLSLPFELVTDERAEPLLRSALLMALATLLEGGEWPTLALYTIRKFLMQMLTALEEDQDCEE